MHDLNGSLDLGYYLIPDPRKTCLWWEILKLISYYASVPFFSSARLDADLVLQHHLDVLLLLEIVLLLLGSNVTMVLVASSSWVLEMNYPHFLVYLLGISWDWSVGLIHSREVAVLGWSCDEEEWELLGQLLSVDESFVCWPEVLLAWQQDDLQQWLLFVCVAGYISPWRSAWLWNISTYSMFNLDTWRCHFLFLLFLFCRYNQHELDDGHEDRTPRFCIWDRVFISCNSLL